MAKPPKFGFADRGAENLDRLAAYDRLETNNTRTANQGERLDLARDKFDFEQAYKMGEQERKLQESGIRQTQAEGRALLAEKALELQKASQLLREQKEALNIEDTIRATQDKIGFLNATRDLKESDADFERKLSDAAVQFPNAHKDEFVQKRTGWMTESRGAWRKSQEALAVETKAREEAKALGLRPETIKAGDITFKASDVNGKTDTFDALNKDIAAATEAYGGTLPPDVRTSLEERGRRIRASVTTPQGTVTETATVNPNQAAIDWVKANPNDPRSEAIKKKLGL